MTEDEDIDIVELLQGDDRHEYCKEAAQEIKLLRKKIEAFELEIAKLEYFRMEIYKQASRRRETVDDYIRGAKGAIDYYETRDPRIYIVMSDE